MPTGSPFRSTPALTPTSIRASVPAQAGAAPHQRIGLLSTYPPKLCGLATFAAALEGALVRAGHRVDIVRIDDGFDDGVGEPGATPSRPTRVAATLVNGDAGSVRNAAAVLSRCDVAIVQHEYGIFGGADGAEVIDLLEAMDVPTIVVLHTVPRLPTSHQRWLLARITAIADRVVVMSRTAHERLTASYPVDPRAVVTIPHGASVPMFDAAADVEPRHAEHPQLLTWGLLGPGKGIEHMIEALSLVGDLDPMPRYTIAGVTHPKVFSAHGDEYRHALMEQSRALGVAGSITFDDTYRDLRALTRFVASSSLVVLPYDSHDQVTSGVLVDAIAAGRPVIATSFPHAVELLATGAGIVVPHADPVALADAIRLVMTDNDVLSSMVAEARRIAPSLSWASVADRYARLSDVLVRTAAAAAVAM